MLACLRMILAFAGTNVSETALAEQVSLDEGGLDPEALAQLANRHGLRAEACRLDFVDIAGLLTSEQFPIVLVDRWFLDGEFTVHAVIPVRVSRFYVTVLDPLRGERRISVAKFQKAMRRVSSWAIAWQL